MLLYNGLNYHYSKQVNKKVYNFVSIYNLAYTDTYSPVKTFPGVLNNI